MLGFVPRREKTPWFPSWLKLLMFEQDYSLEALLDCHITRTCLKHTGHALGALVQETITTETLLAKIQFRMITTLWQFMRRLNFKGSEDYNLQSTTTGNIIEYHAAVALATVLVGAAIIGNSKLLRVVRALRLDAAHKVFPNVPDVSAFVPWTLLSCTDAEPPLIHGQYLFHHAQQKCGKTILVVWVM